jgi:hypothetical protein
MGLKHFLKSFFYRANPSGQLDDAIWKSSLRASDEFIASRRDVATDRRRNIAMVFACGLVHLIDRKAFELIPEKRAQVIETLIARVILKELEPALGSDIPREEKERLMKAALNEMNEALQFYAQCKKVTATGGESQKGTLLWEFGKRFAEAANHPKDITFILFGSGMLVEIANAIRIQSGLRQFARAVETHT